VIDLVVQSLRGSVGTRLFIGGIVLFWIAVHFNFKMQMDVKRLASSKAKGLRNLFETIDNGRVWREHKRLFPVSNTRRRAKAFFIAAAVAVITGFVLFALRA
jgi:hypothetical protein